MSKSKELKLGKKFGSLTVMSPLFRKSNRGEEIVEGYLCKCEICSKAMPYRIAQLESGVAHCIEEE